MRAPLPFRAPAAGRTAARRRRWGPAALALALMLGLMAAPAGPAYAATGSLYADGITAPAGFAWMGGYLWVSDHLNGFCRVDPQAGGTYALNTATCSTAAVSPGAPAYDPATHFVYVPDNSSKSQGIWRLTFNPATGTVGAPVLLVPAAGIGLTRPAGVALGPDGHLYVGAIKSGAIRRIVGPGTASPTAETIGRTADNRGVAGIAFAGGDLYLAGEGVSVIRGAAACTGACVAAATAVSATAPSAIAAAGSVLFVAETPVSDSTILRYDISTGTESVYATAGNTTAGGSVAFRLVSGLAADPSGNLFVGDDPSDGALEAQGHIWLIGSAAPPPPPPGDPGTPPPPPPPPPPPGTVTLYADGMTSPAGGVWMGSRFWVSDHLNGFCRMDPQADGTYAISAATCNLSATSPGTPAFDAAANLVYIPDNSSKSQGVWRLRFDPATGTVSDPVLLAPTGGIGPTRPGAVALGPDGNLYVAAIKSGIIRRIVNPGGASQTVQAIGSTASGRGAGGLAFAGNDLYLVDTGAVTVIANAAACSGTCVASASPMAATEPSAIAAGGGAIFVADTPTDASTILRLDLSTGVQSQYATSGSFQFVSGLSTDPAGNLYVADDPSDGLLEGTGRIWLVTP